MKSPFSHAEHREASHENRIWQGIFRFAQNDEKRKGNFLDALFQSADRPAINLMVIFRSNTHRGH